MCGIAAVIGDDVPASANADAARDIISYRGPDDCGSWRTNRAWLASRRLAVLDVSEAGRQPFEDHDTGTVIVFNGTIHNYIELRHELEARGHTFRSQCDTEVLLHAYLEWGETCVSRFNGMWGFVIWDPSYERAFFSRDRFGIKPLFITRRRDGVAFASEPKVLLRLFPDLRSVDPISLYRLLAEKRIYSDERSFYARIKAVPARHVGTYTPSGRRLQMHRFWEIPPQEPHAASFPEAVDQFGTLLDDATRLRVRSDVPVALTFSGGLDSTAVLHGVREGLGPAQTVRAYTSVYGDGVAELPWARRAAAPYQNVELMETPALVDRWLEILRRIVWHLDGPCFSPAVFPVWQIMEVAHNDGVKVVLEGQGADELLGGYPQHLAAGLLGELEGVISRHDVRAIPTVARAFVGAGRYFPLRRVMLELAMEAQPAIRLWDRKRSTVISALRPEFVALASDAYSLGEGTPAVTTRLSRSLADDFARALLPGFLHYGDAVGMAHSIETRLPFLDYRVVELCFRLVDSFKVKAGETKAILRAHLRSIGQQAIAARHRKQGYPTPANEWMARDGGAPLKGVLLDDGALVRDYLDADRLTRLIDRHAAGAFSAGDVLFGLLCTELWLQDCIALPVARGGMVSALRTS